MLCYVMGQVPSIKLKKDFESVQHPPRFAALKPKPAYMEELWQLCNEGIITPVKEHSE